MSATQEDRLALYTALADIMDKYAEKYPHPDDILKGYGMGMAMIFVGIIEAHQMLPDDIDTMMDHTFENIRTCTFDLLRRRDQGHE